MITPTETLPSPRTILFNVMNSVPENKTAVATGDPTTLVGGGCYNWWVGEDSLLTTIFCRRVRAQSKFRGFAVLVC